MELSPQKQKVEVSYFSLTIFRNKRIVLSHFLTLIKLAYKKRIKGWLRKLHNQKDFLTYNQKFRNKLTRKKYYKTQFNKPHCKR